MPGVSYFKHDSMLASAPVAVRLRVRLKKLHLPQLARLNRRKSRGEGRREERREGIAILVEHGLCGREQALGTPRNVSSKPPTCPVRFWLVHVLSNIGTKWKSPASDTARLTPYRGEYRAGGRVHTPSRVASTRGAPPADTARQAPLTH